MSVATHLVAAWMGGDCELSEWAKGIARGNEFEYGDNELHEAVADIFYGDGFSSYAVSSSSQVAARDNIRESLTREDFDAIDWAFVRESLLGE